MELFDAFKKRHSYRGLFSGDVVCRGDLKKIVEAGLIAPSGCNKQTAKFVIVDDKDTVSKIASLKGANPAVASASAYILCIIDTNPEPVFEGLSFQVEDCAAAVENMLLAVAAMGYASVWIDGWLRREGRSEKIAQWIGLPEDKLVRILLPVGVPLEKRHQPDKIPFAQRVWFNEYGE